MINKKMDYFARIIGRLLFLALFIFEILNWLKILHYNIYFTWLGLVLTTFFGVIILETISYFLKKKRGKLFSGFAYITSAFLLYFDAMGDTLSFYRLSWYDQVAHFMAGSVMTLMIYFILKQADVGLSLKLKLAFAMCTTATLGTIYEIEEYLEDLVYHTNRLGDSFDTANDLLMNLCGALLMFIFIYSFYCFKNSKKKNISS